MTTISGELSAKLAAIRAALSSTSAVAARLRGVDWFAWATCGGSNVVILTTETGVAEVLVTADRAWVLTDEIEAARLAAEEVPPGLEVWAGPWNDPVARQAFVDGVVERRRRHQRPPVVRRAAVARRSWSPRSAGCCRRSWRGTGSSAGTPPRR